MKFAAFGWLAGTALALVVAAFLVAGGFLLLRAVRRFGDEDLVMQLTTARAGRRRTVKGVLVVLAVALGFVALAKPQYGRGTRLIPATNLDVVIVLDYSKSMYAGDVPPSRSERAKSEVGRLIAELPGARFGAVAFAGEPLSFPLTSDGAAIAQFFRQLVPNDLPVGGTAIARALEAGRQLFERDPLSKKHKRVMVLVTDGEDLEGDPVSVAESLGAAGIAVNVVQIGGRTAEPLPQVDEAGKITGWRTDEEGHPITTSLSAEGEAQLAKIAEVTGGRIVRSARGETGISEVAASLRSLMTEKLSERVETVYADVYFYPAALAVLLLLIETFIPEARVRKRARASAPAPAAEPHAEAPRASRKRPRRAKTSSVATLLVLLTVGCANTEGELFTRHSPAVDEAIAALGSGDAGTAAGILEEYLETGACEAGKLETPPSVREKPNASFDLGLALFALGERYGARFDEAAPAGQGDPALAAKRSDEVDCALKVVRIAADDLANPPDLRLHAAYLAGNLEFLRGAYEDAVKHYDSALKLSPAEPEGRGDPVARDAAHNRAVALRRIEDEKPPPDAGADSPPPSPDGGTPDGGSPDGGDQSSKDGGSNEPSPDGGQGGAGDGGSSNGAPDGGSDQGQDGGGNSDQNQSEPPKEPPPPPEPPPQSGVSQDERMLDMLEQAPTLQQEAAKQRAGRRRGFVMEDK